MGHVYSLCKCIDSKAFARKEGHADPFASPLYIIRWTYEWIYVVIYIGWCFLQSFWRKPLQKTAFSWKLGAQPAEYAYCTEYRQGWPGAPGAPSSAFGARPRTGVGFPSLTDVCPNGWVTCGIMGLDHRFETMFRIESSIFRISLQCWNTAI